MYTYSDTKCLDIPKPNVYEMKCFISTNGIDKSTMYYTSINNKLSDFLFQETDYYEQEKFIHKSLTEYIKHNIDLELITTTPFRFKDIT